MAGIAVVAIRVSFTGDLGWELHCAEADQVALYEALVEAGRRRGCGAGRQQGADVAQAREGVRAPGGRDFSPEYWPQESGLDGLIRSDKEFLNMHAWLRIEANAPREEMVMLEIDATTADASGSEADLSGPMARRSDRSPLAVTAIPSASRWRWPMSRRAWSRPGDTVHVAILGRPHTARRLAEAPFDPEGLRLRGRFACRRACGLGRRALK